jgi:hypothetical protein
MYKAMYTLIDTAIRADKTLLHMRADHGKERKEQENNTSDTRRPTYHHNINKRSHEESHEKQERTLANTS